MVSSPPVSINGSNDRFSQVGTLPPQNMCLLWSSQHRFDCSLMCSTFSVCSTRCSITIMKSMTPCNLLLAFVPLVPMQSQPKNLCSTRLSTSLRPSCCQRDPNSCPSFLCDLYWFVLRVVVLLHFVRSSLPFLAVVFTLSFVFVLALSVPFVLLALAFAKYSVLFQQSLAMIPHHEQFPWNF